MNNEEELTKKYNLKFSRKNDLDLFKDCLIGLMDFVFSDSKKTQLDIDIDLAQTKPNRKRQKILRELGFLDLLSKIVQSAFPSQRFLNKVNLFGVFEKMMLFVYY
jgi:hypothetical protein